jgi:hypothetical protein
MRKNHNVFKQGWLKLDAPRPPPRLPDSPWVVKRLE